MASIQDLTAAVAALKDAVTKAGAGGISEADQAELDQAVNEVKDATAKLEQLEAPAAPPAQPNVAVVPEAPSGSPQG